MKNHYTWNTMALVKWLRREFKHFDKTDLEAKLQIPGSTIVSWLNEVSPSITLGHIRAIARYRGWSLSQAIVWLELKSAHIEELFGQDDSRVV